MQVYWAEEKIILYCFFDGEISEEDQEEMSCVATEVSCDFPIGTQVIAECIRIDSPRPIPKLGKEYVYARDDSYSSTEQLLRSSKKGYLVEGENNPPSEMPRRGLILLSCQNALLGSIAPNLGSSIFRGMTKKLFFTSITIRIF